MEVSEGGEVSFIDYLRVSYGLRPGTAVCLARKALAPADRSWGTRYLQMLSLVPHIHEGVGRSGVGMMARESL